ncbi:ABC transporter permease [Thauera sp.]|uniref:MlaE family ABC transporter permease n=1 Tax=Thauera sp. TaxID=1905334 RepID=UPI00257D582B|nr:ABC transporter permease [Thauera sp.]
MSRGQPAAARVELAPERLEARVIGDWTIRTLMTVIAEVRQGLALVPANVAWNLSGLGRLDSFGATLLWRAWKGRWPERLVLDPAHRAVIERIALSAEHPIPAAPRFTVADAIATLGGALIAFVEHLLSFVALLGRLGLDLVYLLRNPREWPLLEISANVFKVGVKAMPVTALVGFLIGVVLSYLSALQLKIFGADAFIVNILGLGIIRELGPVLVSVLVAGRSGSAMTAQLGVMRVTEEIDALAAMGVSRSLRLVLPKVIALTLAMPLLVLWTSNVALIGGWVSALVELDISFHFFVTALPDAVPIANLYIGLAKGAVFGLLIALIACHFGLRVQPNTESLSTHTTASVVSAITVVILADAVFAIATRSIGIPG